MKLGLALLLAAAFGAFMSGGARAADKEGGNAALEKKAIDCTLFIEIKGKRIYSCCKECLEMLKANPEKFIKDLEEDGSIKFDSLENCQYFIEKAPSSKTDKWRYGHLKKIVTPIELTSKAVSDNTPNIDTGNTPKADTGNARRIVILTSPRIDTGNTPKAPGENTPRQTR